MKIQATLLEKELNEAILTYVTQAGYPVEGMDVHLNLIKGRGPNGTHAVVDFIPSGTRMDVIADGESSYTEETSSEVSEPPFTVDEVQSESSEETQETKDVDDSSLGKNSLFN